MKKITIDSSLFIENREKLCKKLKPNSIAIINSNDIYPSNADGTLKFKQNNDLIYLTGVSQEYTSLLLYPDCAVEDRKEILFIRDYDPDVELWEGTKLTDTEAKTLSGINTIKPYSKLLDHFHELMLDAENIYLNLNEHHRAHIKINSQDARFIDYCKKNFPLHNYFRLAPLIYDLRGVKSNIEIKLIKEACALTAKGFDRILKFVKPGVMEYEIRAELVHEYQSSGYDIADYEPIVASGVNSCALHYDANNAECKDGSVLLLDAAASCGPYNADMTRTIPVNGKFTKRQREVYEAVLRIFKATALEIKPGRTIKEIDMTARELTAKELLGLKLISKNDIKNLKQKSENFKKYYPHDVAHFLGMDVHDVGSQDKKLQSGMVLTCEPGIYIKEEGLGVRIENDFLVTVSGSEDLMKGVPIEADEIENAMS